MAAEIKEQFEGKWTSYKMENGDKLMEAMGAGFFMRKLSSLASPKMIFAVDGDTITVTTTIGPKTITVSFKLGEEFEFSPPPDEKPATGLAQWSEGKLHTVITPKDPKGKVQNMTREIVDGELVQVIQEIKVFGYSSLGFWP